MHFILLFIIYAGRFEMVTISMLPILLKKNQQEIGFFKIGFYFLFFRLEKIEHSFEKQSFLLLIFVFD